MEITKELVDQLRNHPDPSYNQGDRVCALDFDMDLMTIWERYCVPNMVITTFVIAKNLIDVYSDRARVIVSPFAPGNMKYTALEFGGPLPTSLVIVPSLLCDGEYFILNSDSPDDIEAQVYRKEIGTA